MRRAERLFRVVRKIVIHLKILLSLVRRVSRSVFSDRGLPWELEIGSARL